MNYAAMDIHFVHLSTFVVDILRDEKHKWIAQHWLPEGSLDEHPEYSLFAQQGLIQVMPGEVADINYMVKDVCLLGAQHDFVEISHDSWNPQHIFQLLLEREGFTFTNHILMFETLSEPSDVFLSWRQELLNDNPVLAWMFENTKFVQDAVGHKKPSRINSNKPIGGLVAGIMALGRSLREEHIPPTYIF